MSSGSSAAIDERQPLLPTTTTNGDSPPGYDAAVKPSGEEDGEPQISNTGADPVTTKPIPTRRSKWSIALYSLLTAIAVALGIVLVIGFINADETDFDLKKALKSALGGGLSGAAAMILQVLTLMPLRTTMNYQYRYGLTTGTAIRTLHSTGGFPRFYSGLVAALVQGPISRFGDTAANAGILALLQSNGYLNKLPSFGKTVFASAAAAAFRMVLTPIDTLKTTLQTQGRAGWGILKERVKRHGPQSLFWGAFATAAATFVGHYPWFGVYNYLSAALPPPTSFFNKLLRQAFIGFCASIASDTISNSLRVIKTYRQTNDVQISYADAAREVVRTDGWRGLLGRGLKTRILANGLQGIMFSILWKLFLDLWNENTK